MCHHGSCNDQSTDAAEYSSQDCSGSRHKERIISSYQLSAISFQQKRNTEPRLSGSGSPYRIKHTETRSLTVAAPYPISRHFDFESRLSNRAGAIFSAIWRCDCMGRAAGELECVVHTRFCTEEQI
jgi:hypothetical protein